MRARHLLIRIATPLIWRFSERQKLAALQKFSDTELDSGWQSLHALEKISDPETKAVLFRHALEEFYHADMFAGLVRSYANAPLNRPVFTREAILGEAGRSEEILDFLVRVHVGEQEINGDFLVYGNANIEAPIRDLFQKVRVDEAGHEQASWEVLSKFSQGQQTRLAWLTQKERFGHAWRRYVSFSQEFGKIWLSSVLTVVYLVLGPIFYRLLRRRLGLGREEQLEILRQQLKAQS